VIRRLLALAVVTALFLLLGGVMAGYAMGTRAQWDTRAELDERHATLHADEVLACRIVAKVGGRSAARLATVLIHHGATEERPLWGDELAAGSGAASP